MDNRGWYSRDELGIGGLSSRQVPIMEQVKGRRGHKEGTVGGTYDVLPRRLPDQQRAECWSNPQQDLVKGNRMVTEVDEGSIPSVSAL